MWILTRLLQQLQPILLHNTLRNIVICVYNTWSIILWYSYYWSGNWYCYQKPMIAVCRGGNTDLKCPSSTLQRGFWQVAEAFSEKFFQKVFSVKIFRKFCPWKFPGLYGGIYLAQNYKVPVVPDPQNLYQKAAAWLETLKKDGGKED